MSDPECCKKIEINDAVDITRVHSLGRVGGKRLTVVNVDHDFYDGKWLRTTLVLGTHSNINNILHTEQTIYNMPRIPLWKVFSWAGFIYCSPNGGRRTISVNQIIKGGGEMIMTTRGWALPKQNKMRPFKAVETQRKLGGFFDGDYRTSGWERSPWSNRY